ncbi:acetyltransferase [Rouxiella silvae]|uniref:acetyltransferase n=1 Tax=Rouxiella silvae TaxID=1646373 RepID=UPI0039EF053F
MLEFDSKEIKLASIFNYLVNFIECTERLGSCHDTSAIFYMLSSELGFNPKLNIGEVYEPVFGNYFDHSWVTIDGQIYDAAIAYPYHGGVKVSGPIFNSVDQDSQNVTDLNFEYKSNSGLDPIALGVSKMTLSEYEEETNANIWNITVSLGDVIGFNLDRIYLYHKYGNVIRDLV